VNFRAGHREAEARLEIASLETGAGAEGRRIEAQVFVVIGEALHHSVAASEPPAAACGGHAGGEVGGECGRDCAHLISSCLFAPSP
jgi:hypothetical protein